MRKTIIVIIILLLVMTNVSAVNINFVTEKDGETVIKSDNLFMPESTLKVQVTVATLNHYDYRLIAMDYVMLIEDPHENIIFVDLKKDRSRSYTDNSSVIFTKKIPLDWVDGVYTIDLYSYDRVNYHELRRLNKMGFDVYDSNTAINELSVFYDDPSDNVLESMEVLKSRSRASVEKNTLEFFIDNKSNPCKLRSLSLNSNVIAEDSYVQLFIEFENIVPHPSSQSYDLMLNTEIIDVVDVVMAPLEVKTVMYEVVNPQIGENELMIGDKSIGFRVSGEPLGPVDLKFLDITTDDFKIYANEHFIVSVEVMNSGACGKETVFIRIDDNEIFQEVELDYGEKKIIEFEAIIEDAGTHRVEIIGTDVSKVLFVQEERDGNGNGKDDDKEDDSFVLFNIMLYGGFIGVFIILLLLFIKHRSKLKTLSPDIKWKKMGVAPELPCMEELKSQINGVPFL